MQKISVCMIVKNEEKNIENILNCVKCFADEIIVVDTGSTDKTKLLASQFTDKIFDFEWCDDFSKARNFSFSKATGDYMLWVDGDDFILQKDIEKLKKLKKKRLNADIYMLKYVASFDENFVPQFSYYRERLVRRDKNFVWVDPIHEVIIPRGKIEYLDICIYHNKKDTYTDRNLKIYQNLIAKKVKLSPRQRFYYARELMYNNLFDQAIKEFSSFLLEKDAWKENKIEACLNLARCYQAKSQPQNALTALFGSFVLGVPRGEIVYEIGNVFLSLNRLDESIFWYKNALKLTPDPKSGAFVSKDCYDFLPALQLCLCYYKKGDLKSAERYHNLAKKIYPNDPSVLHNEKFFQDLKKQKLSKK